MAAYIIVFQVSNEEKRKSLIDDIKRWFGSWARITDNCFAVQTSKFNSRDIRTKLSENRFSADDRILVLNIEESGWASYGLPKEVSSYLNNI